MKNLPAIFGTDYLQEISTSMYTSVSHVNDLSFDSDEAADNYINRTLRNWKRIHFSVFTFCALLSILWFDEIGVGGIVIFALTMAMALFLHFLYLQEIPFHIYTIQYLEPKFLLGHQVVVYAGRFDHHTDTDKKNKFIDRYTDSFEVLAISTESTEEYIIRLKSGKLDKIGFDALTYAVDNQIVYLEELVEKYDIAKFHNNPTRQSAIQQELALITGS